MLMSQRFLAIVAGTFLLGTGMSWAKTTAADVLNDLHQSNQKEIHWGNLAQQKGSSAVQSYGKMLTEDHTQVDKQVTDLAAKDGIAIKPAKKGMIDDMQMKHMSSLNGNDFDRTFAKHMIDDHQKDIEKLQAAQKSDLPADVRELVGDTLPKLQKHLEEAQKIYGQPS